MSDNLQKIIDRVKAGNYTPEDVREIVSEIYAGKLVLASGSGAVAIGGDAANARIATGNQNVIGDGNTVIYIDGIESQVIQSVVDRYSGINNTFQRLFPPSASSAVDWDWGMKLLKQKQLPEIRKRLTDTLGFDRVLMDVSIEERQNWVNRSPLAANRTLQIDGRDCGTLDANKMLIDAFGRDDVEGKLLILGAPGAGKTTALLSLAEQLVEGAISQAKTVIPVIFELSTWQNDNQSIQSWLIEQLYDLHGGNRKSKLYEKWLERQVLLPLMDGLDELGLERQKKCTEKLNEFAEHYPHLVVCCRVKEFEAVDIKLRNLRGAVCLQSLSDLQIQAYFGSLKRPELWEAIQTTPYLQAMLEPNIDGDSGLLRVPLFVKLVADVYDPQQPISGKADLLDKYIERQLSFDKREIDRRKGLDEYKWAYKTVKLEPNWNKTRSYIVWIARNLQTNNRIDLLIEKIQPSWIDSTRLQYCYKFIDSLYFVAILSISNSFQNNLLVFGIVLNLGSMLIAQLTLRINNIMIFKLILKLDNIENSRIKSWYISRLISLLDNGLIGDSIKIEAIESLQKIEFNSISREDIFVNMKGVLVMGCIGFIFGLCIPLVIAIDRMHDSVLHHTTVFEGLKYWLIFGLFSGLVCGLILGLFGLIFLIFALTFLMIIGFKKELRIRLRPNQGIINSCLYQAMITVFILSFFSLLHLWNIGISLVLALGFSMGGYACFQHLSLRIILWQSGLPWNFARFLNYCVERRLLLRVGGSYRFLHRELLDHFAQSNH